MAIRCNYRALSSICFLKTFCCLICPIYVVVPCLCFFSSISWSSNCWLARIHLLLGCCRYRYLDPTAAWQCRKQGKWWWKMGCIGGDIRGYTTRNVFFCHNFMDMNEQTCRSVAKQQTWGYSANKTTRDVRQHWCKLIRMVRLSTNIFFWFSDQCFPIGMSHTYWLLGLTLLASLAPVWTAGDFLSNSSNDPLHPISQTFNRLPSGNLT